MPVVEKRYDELSKLIRGLYENLVSGLLPERQYKQLMKQYDDEQAELETKIEEMTLLSLDNIKQMIYMRVAVETMVLRDFLEVQTPMAVSYTHLDVYKRQDQNPVRP